MAIKFGLVTKIGIGVGSISAIATGGYLTSEYISKTTINDFLKKDDLVLLTKNDARTQWGKRWAEYVKEGNKWSLSSFESSKSNSADAPEDFKNACIQNSSYKVKSQKDAKYKEIAKLCTKDFPVSELITKDKTIELISKKQTTSDQDKWKNSWERYFDNAKESNPLGLDLNGAKKETLHNDYGKKCEAKEKEEIKNNKDKNYEIVKKWCTETIA